MEFVLVTTYSTPSTSRSGSAMKFGDYRFVIQIMIISYAQWIDSYKRGILHNFEIFSSIFTEKMNKFLSLSDYHWRRISSNLVPIRMMKIRHYWKDLTLLVHAIAWLVTIIASKLSWTKTCRDVCNWRWAFTFPKRIHGSKFGNKCYQIICRSEKVYHLKWLNFVLN